MKKYFLKPIFIGILGISGIVVSCSDDEGSSAPTISISETEVTAAPGEVVSVDITAETEAGFGGLVVTKLWDGVAQGEPEAFDVLPPSYAYTVTEEDAEHVVTINFTVLDKKGKSDQVELVVVVELTPRQLLLKYDWRLNEEFRKKTSENDIDPVYTDDVYRFNEDGTYSKSIGANKDGFSDDWFNYCYYNLNDNTLRLLMSKTGAFGEKVTDTLDITVIDDTKFHADVTYYGLDQLDPEGTQNPHDPIEYYIKKFVAVAKVSNFDPYEPGNVENDNNGPAGYCEDVVFEND